MKSYSKLTITQLVNHFNTNLLTAEIAETKAQLKCNVRSNNARAKIHYEKSTIIKEILQIRLLQDVGVLPRFEPLLTPENYR